MSSDQKKTDELPGTSVHKTDEHHHQRRHPSINREVITEQSFYTQIVLTLMDAQTIDESLEDASKDWFNLGLAFGLELSELKNIEDEYRYNKRRLTEVVVKRLQVTDPEHPMTWSYICECLRSPTVERNDVANEIEEVMIRRSLANRLTLQELIKHHSLTDEQLNSEIKDSDTPYLASCFDNVELYSSEMGLAITEQTDVTESCRIYGNQIAMMKCLKIWIQHNPSQATYRALLDIALRLGKGEIALEICQQLIQQSSSEEFAREVITKQSSSTPIVLTLKDALTIVESLRYADKDWFNLGLAFGLELAELKNIEVIYEDEKSYIYDYKRHLMEVVVKRLQVTDPEHPMTWPYICECLRSPTVKCNDVAEEIEGVVIRKGRPLIPLQKLIKRHSLTDEQLNSEIKDSDTPKLALYFANVELYSSAMGLAITEQTDVTESCRKYGTQIAMMKCLQIWKQHNPSQATYRALLDIVLGLWQVDIAHEICQQLIQQSSSEEYAREVITKQSSSTLIVLTLKDALTIVESLRYADKDWFNLGLAFGLELAELKNIEDEYRYNERRLKEVVVKRLQVTDPEHPMTWPYIWECLMSPTVKCNDVAEKVKEPSVRQKLIKQYHLTDEQLNSKIVVTDHDIPELALCFDDTVIELYSTSMGLPPAEAADVNRLYHIEGNQTAMMKCLQFWKQNKGFQATYGALLDMALKLEEYNTADKICQQLIRLQWQIKQQPIDVLTKVGEEVKFFIVTSPGQVFSYDWCFNDQSISAENVDYSGARTSELVILKSLSKHCGSYKCIVTDSNMHVHIPSIPASLEIDGTQIEIEECKILGKILPKLTSLQVDGLDLDIEKLIGGTSTVTYEELQIVLSRSAQTLYLSTDLEQKLRERIQEDKIYDEAMKNSDQIKLFYLKMLALGPGQIGKSTFIRRLLGIMKWDINDDLKNGPPGSTDLSECRTVFLDYNQESVALSTEQSASAHSSEESWHLLDKADIGKELRALVSLINVQTKSRKVSAMASSEEMSPKYIQPIRLSQPSDAEESDQLITVSTNENIQNDLPSFEQSPHTGFSSKIQGISVSRSEIDEAYEEFENLRYKHYSLSDSPDDDLKSPHAIINIADVGGQPAFLEILPSLTIGPAMYLVFMKLLWELDTPQETRYKGKNKTESSICKNYTYTPEEVIFTALSSIACFGHSDEEVEKYVTDNKKINSLVLIMGTYADDLKSGDEQSNTKKVNKTNKQLDAKLSTTPFYNDGRIEYYTAQESDPEVLFPINNKSGGKLEVDEYRKVITTLIKSRFREYKIPAQWLMFSICLKILAQKKKKSVIEFIDCVKVGDRFGMNEATVRVALRFLHKYIGLVMYFQKDETLMKDIVICNPRDVFTSISELIFNIYDPPERNVQSSVILRFKQKGFFSPEDHIIATRKNNLPIEYLLPLLEYLNIAVPMDVDSIKGYFLPAVLQTATSELLNKPLDGADPDRDPEPLCIQFKTGFVPLGFVSALVANLLKLNGDKHVLKLFKKEKVYKNKITFLFKARYIIVLISRAKYCEFRVSRAATDGEFSSTKCCTLIIDMLQKSIKNVIDRMRQSSLFQLSQGYDFAFKCPRSDCKGNESSLAVINPGDLKSLMCESCGIAVHATGKMCTWFTKDLAIDDDQKDPGTTIVHELMVKHGVTDEQLDREIEQDDLAPVAMHFDDVELYLNPLKLTASEQADVRQENYLSRSNQGAVINCLSIWRGHEPSKATFRALIRILLDLRKEKIATKICQYLKEKDYETFGEEYLVQVSQTARKSDLTTQRASKEFSTGGNKVSTRYDSESIVKTSSSDEGSLSSERLQYSADPVQRVGATILSTTDRTKDRTEKVSGCTKGNEQAMSTDRKRKHTESIVTPLSDDESTKKRKCTASASDRIFEVHTTTQRANRITLQDLIERYRLTDKQVNSEIKKADTPVVAHCFDNVELYSSAMELTTAEEANARRVDGNQTAIMKCLQIWKQRNPSQATYRAILDIARRLGNRDTADQICQQFTRLKLSSSDKPYHNTLLEVTYEQGKNKWRNIGVSLKLSMFDLESIRQNNPSDIGDCFCAMLLKWFESSPDCYLDTFLKALRSKLVELENLCPKVEEAIFNIANLGTASEVDTVQLNREIPDDELPVIAAYFNNVELYSQAMGLSPAEQVDVRTALHQYDTQTAITKCLLFWQQRDPYKATYGALLELLLRLHRTQVATQVCQYLAQNKMEGVVTGSDS
ncbi:uncharacterized protein LOC135335853 isoform X4 [Halichondria panicea]|uniref:uncharacterized protein LOC135335853 isoform X4 n=1 Tax=Halichondria panicea TaxID=6063 RepID=UPI00312B8FBF